ncbi:MAG: hypothetical protein Crog4KO_03060 [Crocinitomicaceae bacterium]
MPIFLAVFSFSGLQAQESIACDSIYSMHSLDEEPIFQEGYAKALNWIVRNLDYPSDVALEAAETGNVVVFVLIDHEGIIQSVTIEGENVMQNLHELRDCTPIIAPAIADGMPVCTWLRFSIRILLN